MTPDCGNSWSGKVFSFNSTVRKDVALDWSRIFRNNTMHGGPNFSRVGIMNKIGYTEKDSTIVDSTILFATKTLNNTHSDGSSAVQKTNFHRQQASWRCSLSTYSHTVSGIITKD